MSFAATTLIPATPVAPTASVPTPAIAAGIEPQAYEAILYGKDRTIFVGGKMLMGGRIIEGPWFGGTQTDPTVSFIASHAHNIGSNPFDIGDTVVTQARLRGQAVWENGVYTATDKLPSGSFDWKPGNMAQTPLAQSILRFGSSAIAYRPDILSSWTDIPLKPFGGIIPFPSVLVECSRFGDPADGIPRQDALDLILDHMRIPSGEREVSVSGSDPAWIVSNNMTLLDFLRQLRSIFVNWQITYTDKLRIIEPTSFSLAADITSRNHIRGSMIFQRSDPLSLTREKQYTYIDVDRDYEMNVAVAKEDISPVPTSSGLQTVSLELPIVTTAAQAVADVHRSLYEELANQEQLQFVGNVSLFGLEVGDGVRYLDGTINHIGRINQTQRDFNEWTITVNSGRSLNCGAEIEAVAIYMAANNTFGEDEFDLGFGYAPIIPLTFPDEFPIRTRANWYDFQIAQGAVSSDGEAVFVNDSETHSAAFRYVFVDETYVYHVDADPGSGSAALIIRLRLDDPSDRTVLDWGTYLADESITAGFGFAACFYDGKIWLGLQGGDPANCLIVIDVSNFTTAGINVVVFDDPNQRPLGMAGLGDYVYINHFTTSGIDSGSNYVSRVHIDTLAVDTIDGGSGAEYRIGGAVADIATGKIFFAANGKDSLFTYPTINDRNVGVLDTNVTFDNAALTFFSVLQDTNVDHATQQTMSSKQLAPWIVNDAVRMFTETSGGDIRISSFSTDDYTVADVGMDISAYVGEIGVSQEHPHVARVYGDYTYVLCTDDLSIGVKLLRIGNGYESVVELSGGGTP